MPCAAQGNEQEQQNRQKRKVSTIFGVAVAVLAVGIISLALDGYQLDKAATARIADHLRQLPRSKWADTLANTRSPGEVLDLLGDGHVFNSVNSTPKTLDRDGKPLGTIWTISGKRPFQIEQYKHLPSPPERP